jgi:hypothetical protein
MKLFVLAKGYLQFQMVNLGEDDDVLTSTAHETMDRGSCPQDVISDLMQLGSFQ